MRIPDTGWRCFGLFYATMAIVDELQGQRLLVLLGLILSSLCFWLPMFRSDVERRR